MEKDVADFVKIRSKHLMASFGLSQAFAEKEALRELYAHRAATLDEMNGNIHSLGSTGRLEA